MKIFVTGASGFIGSAFCRQANAVGHELAYLIKPQRLDEYSVETVKSFAPDIVMHCAWLTTPKIYLESQINLNLKNVSLHFLQQLMESGIKNIVCCGTCSEYELSLDPLEEDRSFINPRSIYASAKHELHTELLKTAQKTDTKISWARIFFPYGPGEHPDRLISSMLYALKNGHRFNIRTPNAVRDYIHVEDVAAALLFLAERKVKGTYNIGTGRGVALAYIAKLTENLIIKKTPDLKNVKELTYESTDMIVASTSKLNSLGWTSRLSIEAGIRTYCENAVRH